MYYFELDNVENCVIYNKNNIFDDSITYRNEYHLQSSGLKIEFIKNILTVLLEEDTSIKSIEKSEQHRELGNRLFRANKKQNALEASRCYTYAIIAAPNGSTALALAYANRSASISELGYYKEAYEDCVCAIKNGYPDKNMEKIITRQAFCADKLEDYDKLSACLDKLKTMTLSKPFEKQKGEFEEGIKRLSKGTAFKGETQTVSEDACIRQKIMYNSEKGRYLTASKDIKEGEVIVKEKAFSFTPIDELKICNNCAAQHIIPFPCDVCSKVFYCSLKCKKEEEQIHKYMCYAFRCSFLKKTSVIHPATNILLKGLPTIIDQLKTCKTGEEIWERIEEISCAGGGHYAEVLSLITHFENSFKNRDLLYLAISSAGHLAVYLIEFSPFFDLLKDSNCGKPVWTLVISALLLRHIHQITFNACAGLALFPSHKDVEFQCFSDVWSKARRLKRGMLHTYSRVRSIYVALYPHLSTCNHSCDPSFRNKFDGIYVSVLARQHLQKGSEIFNSYVPDYKKLPKNERRTDLKESFHFDCTCKYCSDDYRDGEYVKFYKYRCQNFKCKAVFVPQIENQEWWTQDVKLSFLTCPVCKVKQKLDWYWPCEELTTNPTDLRKALEVFKLSERFLVDHSALRSHICEIAADIFFASWKNGADFSITEFTAMGKAVNYCLQFYEQRNDVRCIVYVAKATYALDLMALGKYFNFDTKKIRQSMEILPTEMKSVFNNYIDDYIGKKFYVA